MLTALIGVPTLHSGSSHTMYPNTHICIDLEQIQIICSFHDVGCEF